MPWYTHHMILNFTSKFVINCNFVFQFKRLIFTNYPCTACQ